MKKSSGFRRTLHDRFFGTKWAVLLLASVLLVFFAQTVDNKSLTQSAIVIGLGIDRTDDAFTVSTQSVVITGGAGESQSSQSYAVHTADGRTISEALDKISQKMGLLVSLSHCNVLVLSQEALRSDHALLFAPLTGTYALPEQAVVVASADTPSKVLSARTATTVASPYYIQASLLQNLGGDGLTPVTVKDFLAHSLSRSGAVCLPYVEISEMPDQPQTPDGESEGVSEFFLNKNLVVCKDSSFVIGEELAQAANLFNRRDTLGKLSPVLPTGEAVEFRVIDVRQSKKADGMSVKCKIEIAVSFMEAQNVANGGKFTPSSQVVSAAAKELEKEISDNLAECYRLSVERNADFLRLQNEVYKKAGRELPEDCLADISFGCEVKVTVKDSG